MLPAIVEKITADVSLVKAWETVATADGVAAWLMPNNLVAEVGNEFDLQSPFGPAPCRVTAVEPFRYLKFAWDTAGWHLTITLTEQGDQVEITVIHDGWGMPEAIVPKANEPNFVVYEKMKFGWQMLVHQRLAQALAQ